MTKYVIIATFKNGNKWETHEDTFKGMDTIVKKLVKDKKVALVGPANYLNYFEFGKNIDNYDLVARINRGIELVDENNNSKIGISKNLKTRCTI